MLWWKLLSNGATLAELARQIYTTVKKEKSSSTSPPPSGDLGDLYRRVDFLERNELRQAELIKQMAEQHASLAKKAQNAFVLAIVATIIAGISIVWHLVNR